jgi:hypothetical protein
MNRVDYTKEQRALIEAIEEARQQLEHSREFFELVNHPKLIDYAIYMEDAAKAKYAYLLAEAKKLDVKLDCTYVVGEVNAI